MTDYDRELEVKVLTMRELAKNTNSEQAQEILTKLASSYSKFEIIDMLEYYGDDVITNATKPMLVYHLVHLIVTEAVIDRNWGKMFFKALVVANG